MEITETLDITPEELFDQIEKSIMDDIEIATGEVLSRSKLNGYKYKKNARLKGSHGAAMTVKIKRYRYPEVYEVRFTYSAGSNVIKYHAMPTGDGRTVLEYSEDMIAAQKQHGIFGDLNMRWYERKLRRRAAQTIESIVKQAKMDREKRGSNPILDDFEAREQTDHAESAQVSE